MFRLLTPQLRLHRVEQLDVERLRRLGIDSLLLDVDCTLKPYRSDAPEAEVAGWLETLRREGIGLCLVSNGRAGRLQPLADRLEVPLVPMALKPLARGLRRAIAQTGFDPRRTAMVGDQLFADVMAGRAAGLFTILVDPIHPEQEPLITRLKRPLERFFVRGIAYGEKNSSEAST